MPHASKLEQEHRKMEILRLLSKGYSEDNIRRELGIDEVTLWRYQKKINTALSLLSTTNEHRELSIWMEVAKEKVRGIIRECDKITENEKATPNQKINALKQAYEAAIELVLLTKGTIKTSGENIIVTQAQADSERVNRFRDFYTRVTTTAE